MDPRFSTRTTNIRDSVLLSGWLFADLLLALAVIFMVSARGAPGESPAASRSTAEALQITVVIS